METAPRRPRFSSAGFKCRPAPLQRGVAFLELVRAFELGARGGRRCNCKAQPPALKARLVFQKKVQPNEEKRCFQLEPGFYMSLRAPLRREDFFRLWEKHIPVQVRRNDPEAQTTEFYLQIYFAVYPTLPEAQRHGPAANRNTPLHATMAYFKTFLETRWGRGPESGRQQADNILASPRYITRRPNQRGFAPRRADEPSS